jgi:predicted PurR-regulated permease PerM
VSSPDPGSVPSAARAETSAATPPPSSIPKSAPTPSDAGPRTWLRRWRRITQPTPPDIDTGLSGTPDRTSLLLRNPFHIGFFLAAGGMTAYGLVLVLTSVRSVILLVLLSLVIALGLSPAVEWLHKRGLRRGFSVLIVALLVIAIATLAFVALIPTVVEQVTLLFQNAPDFLIHLRENEQIAAIDEQFDIINRVVSFLTSGDLVTWAFGSVIDAGYFMANAAFSTTLTIVLTLYFLASLPSIKEVFYSLSPASRRPRVKYLVSEMLRRIGGYVSGLFLIVLMASVYAALVITIVGATTSDGFDNYALALAALMMLLYFIPVVGSTFAILIIGVVGLFYSPLTGILCLVLLFGYQQFDAYFIQPRVYAKSVQVPGVIVILAAISGGYVAGPMGAILAVPVIAAAMLLYREVLIPHLNRR